MSPQRKLPLPPYIEEYLPQWNKIEKTRNKPSCLFSVEYQEYQENSMGKEESFQQMGLGQLDIRMQKNAVGPLLYNV